MSYPNDQALIHQNTRKNNLNKRLEDIGWALFLIMIGCLLLVPAYQIPPGIWLIGTGLILLGVNAIRYFNSIKVSLFSLVLGIFALAAGLGELLGIKLPLFAIFLILMGVSILLKPFIEKQS
ncbi:MAG TPA: hypothetical protein V6C57_14670 [Coleofasciculaceae cyanobacterium]